MLLQCLVWSAITVFDVNLVLRLVAATLLVLVLVMVMVLVMFLMAGWGGVFGFVCGWFLAVVISAVRSHPDVLLILMSSS